MNIKKTLSLGAVSVLMLAPKIQAADVELVLSGSTAFRSMMYDRVAFMYTNALGGVPNTNPITVSQASSATTGEKRTFFGNMTGVAGLNTNLSVNIKMSWSGSAAGLADLKNGNGVPTINGDGNTSPTAQTSIAPNLALSDVW